MSKQPLCLVVDDSRVIRRVAVGIISSLGLRTAEAEHGLAAVQFCGTTVPDFVLLDWNMPEMDGITCLRSLRAMNLSPIRVHHRSLFHRRKPRLFPLLRYPSSHLQFRNHCPGNLRTILPTANF